MTMFDIIVWILIEINVLVFALPYLGVMTDREIKENYATDPDTFRRGEYYRVLTAGFVHNDLFHLAINMYSLFVMSGITFSIIGAIVPTNRLIIPLFLMVYIVSIVISSIVSILRTRGPSVGASGGVFGLFGFVLSSAVILYALGNTGAGSLIQSMLFTLIINAVIAFTPGSNLDHWGHLGGLLCGVLIGVLFIGFFVFI